MDARLAFFMHYIRAINNNFKELDLRQKFVNINSQWEGLLP